MYKGYAIEVVTFGLLSEQPEYTVFITAPDGKKFKTIGQGKTEHKNHIESAKIKIETDKLQVMNNVPRRFI